MEQKFNNADVIEYANGLINYLINTDHEYLRHLEDENYTNEFVEYKAVEAAKQKFNIYENLDAYQNANINEIIRTQMYESIVAFEVNSMEMKDALEMEIGWYDVEDEPVFSDDEVEKLERNFEELKKQLLEKYTL
ncbi:MAG: hypothetical protein K2Q03_04215 [Sphingobacteriaceae bacterium]|nr:hypothetical protein [Sphingobacteriaceae bacterium]